MKLQIETEILEKMLTQLSDQIHILKGRPEDQIKKLFHKEVVLEVKELSAYAEWVESRLALEEIRVPS